MPALICFNPGRPFGEESTNGERGEDWDFGEREARMMNVSRRAAEEAP